MDTTIKINHYTWKVSVVPKEEIENFLGVTYCSKLTIKLSKDQNKQVLKDTLAHELVHATLFSYGFDQEKYNEEDVANFIGQNIDMLIKARTQILKDLNKHANNSKK